MSRLQVFGQQFDCTAKPYAWPYGVGVHIDISGYPVDLGAQRP